MTAVKKPDPTLMQFLGQILKEAREEAGLSQTEISNESRKSGPDMPMKKGPKNKKALERGWDRNRFSVYENGHTWPPDPELLVTFVAQATGRDPHDMWIEAIERKRSGKPLQHFAAKRRVRKARGRAKARLAVLSQVPPKTG